MAWCLYTSINLVVATASGGARVPRLSVSLSPPWRIECHYLVNHRLLTTDTKVALDLSPQSLAGESPVARLGFFLVVITPVRSLVVLSSLFFMSTLFSSSALA